MGSLSTILSRSSVRLALGLSWSADSDYTRHDRVAPPCNPEDAVHTQNINYGRGIFNHVAGSQTFTMNVAFNVLGKPAFQHNDTISLVEPYRSAIDSLFEIIRLLEGLPQNLAVLMLREEVRGFVPVLICVAKAMEVIRRVSPQFATHTFFLNMVRQAQEYGRCLKELKRDTADISPRFPPTSLASSIPPNTRVHSSESSVIGTISTLIGKP
ncbi:hypothetical protein BDN71DRAFT_1456273 [Pleurotus eryngii]|uniref:Uncharacterized protein n=1 Tax=Pleurotus eryngii TaxID=5323 RepID=A0A9P5ZJR9_PLEER|nr:hypothetical protein BDN71DRAFT_1456273 [Pleurotus eryngii]